MSITVRLRLLWHVCGMKLCASAMQIHPVAAGQSCCSGFYITDTAAVFLFVLLVLLPIY
jgi:hypothetical protein